MLFGPAAVSAGDGEAAALRKGWSAALLRIRATTTESDDGLEPRDAHWTSLEVEFPVECDWALQDGGPEFLRDLVGPDAGRRLRECASRAIAELGPAGGTLRRELETLPRGEPDETPAALDLYARAAEARRGLRLAFLLEKAPRLIFMKHANLGGSHYAYTEGQSDAQDERHFEPGASLCLLQMRGTRGDVRTLLATEEGSFRDPDVDFDGRRVLFAWKKSDRGDDYHLYELDVETGAVVQITAGLGFADYEGMYTPAGDVIFNSTRPVQTVDCWWTEVSNLYTCARDGRFLRRLAFDQVHDNFPALLPDGRVLYTRWDYNDRGQIFVQGLFVMRPDGSGQAAFYGNNSWFPTSLLHARGIPGTTKVVAIASGHHTLQMGKLALVDPGRGTEENAGVLLIAPVRETPAERADIYGQDGELFQYPYPLAEDMFLAAMSPLGRARGSPRFSIYLVVADGRRELLAADPAISCNQPLPLAPRPRPPALPSVADHGEADGMFLLQDVHAGPGLAGVPRGAVKKLRVVALEYRAAGVRTNFSLGPGGDAQASTPISIGNGAWDVKRVLGEATVRRDGSAWFRVPARTPVYFQVLDARGYALQTMRSWATLQPGEVVSCAGCHEEKSVPPCVGPVPMALRAGPETLRPPHDLPRGFSFIRDVQPILDRHCIACHTRRGERPAAEPSSLAEPAGPEAPAVTEAFSLRGETTAEEISGRAWSDAYLALTASRPLSLDGCPPALAGDPEGRLVRWVSAQSAPPRLAPCSTGAVASPLMRMLENGHRGVRLSAAELRTIACWIDLAVPYCGDYLEANVWSEEDREKYARFEEKRRRSEAIERRAREDLRAWRAARGADAGAAGG